MSKTLQLRAEIARLPLNVSELPGPNDAPPPRHTLGIEQAPGDTVVQKGLAWAEAVRERARQAAAERRAAELTAFKAEQAAARRARVEAAEAEANAAAADEAARTAAKAKWAAQAMAAVARERSKEGEPLRAMLRNAETKVISGRRLAMGGLTTLTSRDQAEARAQLA